MKRLLSPILPTICLVLLAVSAFAANPPYEAFLGTNGIIIRSNPPNGKILVDGSFITNGGSPVFVTTNLFVVNNTYTSNLFTTNIFVNQTLVTSNIFATNITVNNLFVTNIFATNINVQNITVNQTLFAISNIFVSNLYATNIIVNNLNVTSNLFVTNLFATNIFVENISVTSNLFVNNTYATNIFVEQNIFTTNLYATNIFVDQDIITSNFFTINNYSSNITVTNIFVNQTVITSNLFVTNLVANTIIGKDILWTNDNGTVRLIDQTRVGVGTNSSDAMWLLEAGTNVINAFAYSTGGVQRFVINSNGEPSILKGITYSWPTAQGAAGTVLTNNGSGVLGWGSSSGGGGVSFANLVWTNDGTAIHPVSTNSGRMWIRTVDGSIFAGSTNVIKTTDFTGNGDPLLDTATLYPLMFLLPTNSAPGNTLWNSDVGVIVDGGNQVMSVVHMEGEYVPSTTNISTQLEVRGYGAIANSAATLRSFNGLPGSASSADLILTAPSGAQRIDISATVVGSFIRLGNPALFQVSSNGDITTLKNVSYSWPSAQGAAQTVLTNNGAGVLGWGAVAGSANPLSGTTNFINLSVQAAKLPATNYPAIDAGWQAWETFYAETNAEGARVNTSAAWQFLVPPDYATNSLKLLINYSLLSTNGPNTSNVVWGASVLVIRSGTTNNVHTNLFGSVVKGSNSWIAKYDGTNIVTNLVIDLGVNSLIMPRDLGVIKLERFPTEDTYGGAAAVHGLQLEYTRP